MNIIFYTKIIIIPVGIPHLDLQKNYTQIKETKNLND